MTVRRICPVCNREVRMPTARRPATNYRIYNRNTYHKPCLKLKLSRPRTTIRGGLNTTHNVIKRYTLQQNELIVTATADNTEYILELMPEERTAYQSHRALEWTDLDDIKPNKRVEKPNSTNEVLGIDVNSLFYLMIIMIMAFILAAGPNNSVRFGALIVMLINFLLYIDHIKK
jgi:hypothetical protein